MMLVRASEFSSLSANAKSSRVHPAFSRYRYARRVRRVDLKGLARNAAAFFLDPSDDEVSAYYEDGLPI